MKKQVAISSVITVLIIFILAGCAKSQGDETESDTVEISTDSPVSYTHLDVYKRQLVSCSRQLLRFYY